MNNNNLTVEQFNQLIQQWSGKNIKITKQELGDQDTIIMKLDDISYHNDTRRIDDYESLHSIHLIGEGTTETGPQNAQPLPTSSYKIPLEDTTRYQFDDIRFSLVNERGTYTIELYD
ncbi:hypothetical protein ACTWQL_15565 [Pseudalkalibacillus sp. R45]|uniref:hypothetical protein n=1 Tax=Pseudalkalibacillus sp. R45 TaxID=3457433 RepID=UPI003FCC2C6D